MVFFFFSGKKLSYNRGTFFFTFLIGFKYDEEKLAERSLA